MKKFTSILLLVCLISLANATVFKTFDDKTISGKIKDNESLRLVIETEKGFEYLDKENISSILDDNGNDITGKYLKVVIRKPVKEAMKKAVIVKDINEMTDREFSIYLNDQNVKSNKKVSNTIWYVCGINFVITVVGSLMYYNNALRHPPIPH